LLREFVEALALRRFGLAVHQEMNVVAHEAVRDNCKLAVSRGTKNLREDAVDNLFADEHRSSFVRAECQRIPVKAGVVEVLETVGLVDQHEAGQGKIQAVRSRSG
jgi:hypothetical protein